MEFEEISILPERIIIYASLKQRFLASLIDVLILLIPDLIISNRIGGSDLLWEIIHGHYYFYSIVGELIQLIIGWLYFALQESGKLQATIGERMMKIKVSDMNYDRISFTKASIRYFSEYISALMLCTGYFIMLWDKKNQNLHDKIAGTLVLTNKNV